MRLIDVDLLRRDRVPITDEAGYTARFDVVFDEEIQAAPTVDAVLVTHARWVPMKVPGVGIVFKCTACEVVSNGGNYCSHCGAIMNEKELVK